MLSSPIHFVPSQPKVAIFRGDGTGRDTYIMHDSGGFVRASCADALTRSSSPFRSLSVPKTPSARIEGKTVIYKSNGTGRDSYIVSDSGGLTTRGYRTAEGTGFWNTLRGYEKLKTPRVTEEPDYFEWAQRTRTGRDAQGEVLRAKTIKNVMQRLSQPGHRQKFSFRVKTKTQDGTLKDLKEKLMTKATDRLIETNSWTPKTPVKVVKKLDLNNLGESVGIRVTRHRKSRSEAASPMMQSARANY